MTVKTERYIDKIVELYRELRPEFIKLAAKLDKRKDDSKRELETVWNNKLLSRDGKEAKAKRIKADIEAIQRELDTFAKNAHDEFAEVREEFNKALNAKFKSDFDEIDSKALTMINTGCLKTDELIALANRYNNPLLTRIIIKQIKTDYADNDEVMRKIRLLEHSETISNDRSLEAIDNAITWAGLGLGEKYSSQSEDYVNMSDLAYADSMDRHFDEAIAGIKNSLLE